MRDNDIVFLNLHRGYLDFVPGYGGFLGIYLLSAFVNANGYAGQGYAGALHRGRELIDEACREHGVQVVGLYCDYANVTENISLARYVKRRYGLPVLLGGPQAGSLGRDFLAESGVDCIVRGEGELTVLELLDYYIDGTGELADIYGIAYLEGAEAGARVGRLHVTPPRPPIVNLDALPYIDADCYLVPRHDWHELSLMTGRGCPFDCIFCHEGSHTRRVRYRSVANVLGEIDAFFAHHPHVKDCYILFTDDAFTLDAQRVHELCTALAERQQRYGFHWFCEGHIHTLAQHSGMIRDMAAAGLQRLQLGIEAGTERVLTAYHKHTTPEEIKAVVAMCRDAGIQQIYGNIILGSAYFSSETYAADLAFGKELLHIGAGTLELGVVTYWPLPGTELTDHPERYGLRIVDRDFLTSVDDFPQTETAEIDRWELQRLAQQMERELAAVRCEMLLAGEVPMERILTWYPSSSVFKSYGFWWQSLRKLPNLHAYGHLLLTHEGMTGREAEPLGRSAHPMRVLSLQQYLHLDEAGGEIADVHITQLEAEVLVLCTGRSSCEAIFRRLQAAGQLNAYEELQDILAWLERHYLIVYSREIECEKSYQG